MRGTSKIRVCCTQMSGSEEVRIEKMVKSLGGEYREDLTRDVDVLISSKVGSEKYKLACKFKIPIVVMRWLEMSMNYKKFLMDQVKSFKLPPLKGCYIVVTGLSKKKRSFFKSVSKRAGNVYQKGIDKNSTHLVCEELNLKNRKCWKALELGIHVVKTEWFVRSFNEGFCQDEMNFKHPNYLEAITEVFNQIKKRKEIEKNNNNSVNNNNGKEGDKKKEILVNKTNNVSNRTVNSEKREILNSHMEEAQQMKNNVDDNNIRKRILENEKDEKEKKKNFLFFDSPRREWREEYDDFLFSGFRFFLCGFNRIEGMELCFNLRKLISENGGFTTPFLSYSTTHILLMNPTVSEEEEIKEFIKNFCYIKVIKFHWVMECLKENKLLSYDKFLWLDQEKQMFDERKRRASPEKKEEKKRRIFEKNEDGLTNFSFGKSHIPNKESENFQSNNISESLIETNLDDLLKDNENDDDDSDEDEDEEIPTQPIDEIYKENEIKNPEEFGFSQKGRYFEDNNNNEANEEKKKSPEKQTTVDESIKKEEVFVKMEKELEYETTEEKKIKDEKIISDDGDVELFPVEEGEIFSNMIFSVSENFRNFSEIKEALSENGGQTVKFKECKKEEVDFFIFHKCVYANEENIVDVKRELMRTVTWLNDCIDISKVINVSICKESFLKKHIPLVIIEPSKKKKYLSYTKFLKVEKSLFKRFMKAMNCEFAGKITPTTDVLICNSDVKKKNRNLTKALNSKIPIVTSEWIYNMMKTGVFCDYSPYFHPEYKKIVEDRENKINDLLGKNDFLGGEISQYLLQSTQINPKKTNYNPYGFTQLQQTQLGFSQFGQSELELFPKNEGMETVGFFGSVGSQFIGFDNSFKTRFFLVVGRNGVSSELSSERETQMKLEKSIRELGGIKKTMEDFDRVTHVILLDSDSKPEAYYYGKAKGIWVLKKEYVIESRNHGEFQPEQIYSVGKRISGKKFSSWIVFCYLGNDSCHNILKKSLEYGGGKILKEFCSKVTHVIVSSDFCFNEELKVQASKNSITNFISCDFFKEYLEEPSLSTLKKYYVNVSGIVETTEKKKKNSSSSSSLPKKKKKKKKIRKRKKKKKKKKRIKNLFLHFSSIIFCKIFN